MGMDVREVEASIVDTSDPRWSKWSQRWGQPVNFSRFDQVELTEDELGNMIEGEYTAKMSYVFDHPALREFVLVTKVDSGLGFTILYKPTIVPTGKIACHGDNGVTLFICPRVDAYVSIDGGKTVCMVYHIRYGTSGTEDVLMVGPVWGDLSRVPENNVVGTVVARWYRYFQQFMHECPERLVESKTTSDVLAGSGAREGRKAHRNKAKIVRVIRIKTSDGSRTAHEISCPAWSVRGHMRRYASGKVGWVEGYTKGRERDNPNAIVPKDYQVVPD